MPLPTAETKIQLSEMTAWLVSLLSVDVFIHAILLGGIVVVPWLFVTAGLRAASYAPYFFAQENQKAPSALLKQYRSFR